MMTGKERLLTLAGLLRVNANNPLGVKFDLESWAALPDKEPTLDCNTTACAMGLACISGVFKSEGLGFTINASPIEGGGLEYFIVPEFGGEQGFGAAARFFGISYYSAENLFSPDSYYRKATKGADAELMVAGRIEEFAKRMD